MPAFGVPNAFASRRMKPEESAIAVVDGEVRVKATDSGPCRSATRRIAATVRSSASSQPIRFQPGSGSPFGRVRGIVFETSEAPVFDHSNAAASGDAEPAIAVNTLRAGRIGHSILLPVVKRVPDPATMVRWCGHAFATAYTKHPFGGAAGMNFS